MNGIRLHSYEILHLLWFLPFVVGLLGYGMWRRRRGDLEKFIQAELLQKKPPLVNGARRVGKSILIIMALFFIIAGLARPAWNEKEITIHQAGRDVVFLIDVSRSMLAEDLAPNRLERAKLAIQDCVNVLQGDRVALVAFAGGAVVLCPLTMDYSFFRIALESLFVGAVGKGGTLIGDAIRTTLDDVFDDKSTEYKDIVLITDGEDHESFPVEAARKAGEKGIRLLVVGLGDEKEGQRIPVTDKNGRETFLKYEGREIWSRLDADTLRKMSKVNPGGQYLPVATGTIDLGKVYLDLIARAGKRELEEKTIERYEEKFQVFLALAFIILGLEAVINERRNET